MVFSKDLSYFFETEPQAMFRVHRRKERVRLPQTGVDEPTYFFESLGYMVPDRHMDPYFAQFIPLEKSHEPRAHMHPGFEFLYMLDGELDLRHGDHHCTLEPGDAVYFDASTPHSYVCAGQAAGRCADRDHAPAAARRSPSRCCASCHGYAGCGDAPRPAPESGHASVRR